MVDRWVNTVCDMCYVCCGIRAHVVDGLVVELEGDPDSPQSRGKMCAKGKAGIIASHNPHRVKSPLKRTNPEKGIGVDPRWQEITWDEAIDTIAGKLKQIQDEPQKLFLYTWGLISELSDFGTAFGTPNIQGGSAHECGKQIHPIEHMAAGGFHQQADLHYCNYAIYVGTNGGVASRASYLHTARDLADARARGMRLVVIDPVGGYAAAKADEWIPIRPGTDAAFALSFMHVLLNELGIYDEEFLKKGSNGPYLVGEDGSYIRDKATGKPQVFDPTDEKVKTYDDPAIKDYALELPAEGRGVLGTPAFQLLKNHVSKYPPEWASPITTIPTQTIRRIAKEFAEAARIGSTITMEGRQLPFRPVALDWAKGPQGHQHGFQHCWSLKMINLLMGNVNVPGGILSTGAAGKKPHHWWPKGGVDGMLQQAGDAGSLTRVPSSFPGRRPEKSVRMDLFELFPVAGHATTLFPIVAAEPEKYGIGYKLEVAIHSLGNAVLGSYGDLKVVEKFLQEIPFVLGFALEINETSEFDDIVLPIPGYLERDDFGAGMYGHLSPVGQVDWYFQIRQKVIEPPPGVRHPQEVMLELADRLDILPEYYTVLNQTKGYKEPFLLKSGQKYSLEQVHDNLAKSIFGPEHGAEWLKQHGVVRYERDVEESYPGPFINARLPVYLEHLPKRADELQKVMDDMKMQWDYSDYRALPEWMPCESFDKRKKGEYDLTAVHFKLPFIYGAFSNENPWINEICERTPYTYKLLINEDVALKKGIKDGDEIWVESPVYKARAIAKLTQCIHPEVVGIGGHFGHWAKGMPVSRGKGLPFNAFLPHDLEHMDKLSTAMDCCVPVKVYKAK